jgi:general stress protein 26
VVRPAFIRDRGEVEEAQLRVAHFSDIEAEFTRRVHSVVWCSVATVDARGRPRSRILHPIWEGPTGWILTHRRSHKSRHIERNPYVSLAYVDVSDIMRPVYADCAAGWVDDPAQKRRIWDMFTAAPPPLGYDPTSTFGSPDLDTTGLLRLTPWRIAMVSFPAPSHEEGEMVWLNEEVGRDG